MSEVDFSTPGTDFLDDTASREDIARTAEQRARSISTLLPDRIKEELKNRPEVVVVDAGAGKAMTGSLAFLEAIKPSQDTVIVPVDAEIYSRRMSAMAETLVDTRFPNVTVEPQYGVTIQQYQREHPDIKADVVLFSYFEAAPQIPVETITNMTGPGSIVIEIGNVGNLPDLSEGGFRLVNEKPTNSIGVSERVWKRPNIRPLPSMSTRVQ